MSNPLGGSARVRVVGSPPSDPAHEYIEGRVGLLLGEYGGAFEPEDEGLMEVEIDGSVYLVHRDHLGDA